MVNIFKLVGLYASAKRRLEEQKKEEEKAEELKDTVEAEKSEIPAEQADAEIPDAQADQLPRITEQDKQLRIDKEEEALQAEVALNEQESEKPVKEAFKAEAEKKREEELELLEPQGLKEEDDYKRRWEEEQMRIAEAKKRLAREARRAARARRTAEVIEKKRQEELERQERRRLERLRKREEREAMRNRQPLLAEFYNPHRIRIPPNVSGDQLLASRRFVNAMDPETRALIDFLKELMWDCKEVWDEILEVESEAQEHWRTSIASDSDAASIKSRFLRELQALFEEITISKLVLSQAILRSPTHMLPHILVGRERALKSVQRDLNVTDLLLKQVWTCIGGPSSMFNDAPSAHVEKIRNIIMLIMLSRKRADVHAMNHSKVPLTRNQLYQKHSIEDETIVNPFAATLVEDGSEIEFRTRRLEDAKLIVADVVSEMGGPDCRASMGNVLACLLWHIDEEILRNRQQKLLATELRPQDATKTCEKIKYTLVKKTDCSFVSAHDNSTMARFKSYAATGDRGGGLDEPLSRKKLETHVAFPHINLNDVELCVRSALEGDTQMVDNILAHPGTQRTWTGSYNGRKRFKDTDNYIGNCIEDDDANGGVAAIMDGEHSGARNTIETRMDREVKQQIADRKRRKKEREKHKNENLQNAYLGKHSLLDKLRAAQNESQQELGKDTPRKGKDSHDNPPRNLYSPTNHLDRRNLDWSKYRQKDVEKLRNPENFLQLKSDLQDAVLLGRDQIERDTNRQGVLAKYRHDMVWRNEDGSLNPLMQEHVENILDAIDEDSLASPGWPSDSGESEENDGENFNPTIVNRYGGMENYLNRGKLSHHGHGKITNGLSKGLSTADQEKIEAIARREKTWRKVIKVATKLTKTGIQEQRVGGFLDSVLKMRKQVWNNEKAAIVDKKLETYHFLYGWQDPKDPSVNPKNLPLESDHQFNTREGEDFFGGIPPRQERVYRGHEGWFQDRSGNYLIKEVQDPNNPHTPGQPYRPKYVRKLNDYDDAFLRTGVADHDIGKIERRMSKPDGLMLQNEERNVSAKQLLEQAKAALNTLQLQRSPQAFKTYAALLQKIGMLGLAMKSEGMIKKEIVDGAGLPSNYYRGTHDEGSDVGSDVVDYFAENYWLYEGDKSKRKHMEVNKWKRKQQFEIGPARHGVAHGASAHIFENDEEFRRNFDSSMFGFEKYPDRSISRSSTESSYTNSSSMEEESSSSRTGSSTSGSSSTRSWSRSSSWSSREGRHRQHLLRDGPLTRKFKEDVESQDAKNPKSGTGEDALEDVPETTKAVSLKPSSYPFSSSSIAFHHRRKDSQKRNRSEPNLIRKKKGTKKDVDPAFLEVILEGKHMSDMSFEIDQDMQNIDKKQDPSKEATDKSDNINPTSEAIDSQEIFIEGLHQGDKKTGDAKLDFVFDENGHADVVSNRDSPSFEPAPIVNDDSEADMAITENGDTKNCGSSEEVCSSSDEEVDTNEDDDDYNTDHETKNVEPAIGEPDTKKGRHCSIKKRDRFFRRPYVPSRDNMYVEFDRIMELDWQNHGGSSSSTSKPFEKNHKMEPCEGKHKMRPSAPSSELSTEDAHLEPFASEVFALNEHAIEPSNGEDTVEDTIEMRENHTQILQFFEGEHSMPANGASPVQGSKVALNRKGGSLRLDDHHVDRGRAEQEASMSKTQTRKEQTNDDSLNGQALYVNSLSEQLSPWREDSKSRQRESSREVSRDHSKNRDASRDPSKEQGASRRLPARDALKTRDYGSPKSPGQRLNLITDETRREWLMSQIQKGKETDKNYEKADVNLDKEDDSFRQTRNDGFHNEDGDFVGSPHIPDEASLEYIKESLNEIPSIDPAELKKKKKQRLKEEYYRKKHEEVPYKYRRYRGKPLDESVEYRKEMLLPVDDQKGFPAVYEKQDFRKWMQHTASGKREFDKLLEKTNSPVTKMRTKLGKELMTQHEREQFLFDSDNEHWMDQKQWAQQKASEKKWKKRELGLIRNLDTYEYEKCTGISPMSQLCNLNESAQIYSSSTQGAVVGSSDKNWLKSAMADREYRQQVEEKVAMKSCMKPGTSTSPYGTGLKGAGRMTDAEIDARLRRLGIQSGKVSEKDTVLTKGHIDPEDPKYLNREPVCTKEKFWRLDGSHKSADPLHQSTHTPNTTWKNMWKKEISPADTERFEQTIQNASYHEGFVPSRSEKNPEDKEMSVQEEFPKSHEGRHSTTPNSHSSITPNRTPIRVHEKSPLRDFVYKYNKHDDKKSVSFNPVEEQRTIHSVSTERGRISGDGDNTSGRGKKTRSSAFAERKAEEIAERMHRLFENAEQKWQEEDSSFDPKSVTAFRTIVSGTTDTSSVPKGTINLVASPPRPPSSPARTSTTLFAAEQSSPFTFYPEYGFPREGRGSFSFEQEARDQEHRQNIQREDRKDGSSQPFHFYNQETNDQPLGKSKGNGSTKGKGKGKPKKAKQKQPPQDYSQQLSSSNSAAKSSSSVVGTSLTSSSASSTTSPTGDNDRRNHRNDLVVTLKPLAKGGARPPGFQPGQSQTSSSSSKQVTTSPEQNSPQAAYYAAAYASKQFRINSSPQAAYNSVPQLSHSPVSSYNPFSFSAQSSTSSAKKSETKNETRYDWEYSGEADARVKEARKHTQEQMEKEFESRREMIRRDIRQEERLVWETKLDAVRITAREEERRRWERRVELGIAQARKECAKLAMEKQDCLAKGDATGVRDLEEQAALVWKANLKELRYALAEDKAQQESLQEIAGARGGADSWFDAAAKASSSTSGNGITERSFVMKDTDDFIEDKAYVDGKTDGKGLNGERVQGRDQVYVNKIEALVEVLHNARQQDQAIYQVKLGELKHRITTLEDENNQERLATVRLAQGQTSRESDLKEKLEAMSQELERTTKMHTALARELKETTRAKIELQAQLMHIREGMGGSPSNHKGLTVGESQKMLLSDLAIMTDTDPHLMEERFYKNEDLLTQVSLLKAQKQQLQRDLNDKSTKLERIREDYEREFTRLRSRSQAEVDRLTEEKIRTEKELYLQIELHEREIKHLRNWNDRLAKAVGREPNDTSQFGKVRIMGEHQPPPLTYHTLQDQNSQIYAQNYANEMQKQYVLDTTNAKNDLDIVKGKIESMLDKIAAEEAREGVQVS